MWNQRRQDWLRVSRAIGSVSGIDSGFLKKNYKRGKGRSLHDNVSSFGELQLLRKLDIMDYEIT